jgi:excinuclease UvrABC nuclease subunit
MLVITFSYTQIMHTESQEYGKTTIKIGIPSGVYFLKLAGEIVYIGKSGNVFSRIFAGHFDDKEFDEVEIHWMPESEILEYERTQIKIHKPKLNQEGLKPRSAPSYLAMRDFEARHHG